MKKLQSVKIGLAILLTIAMMVGVMPGIGFLHVSAEGITVSQPVGDGSAANPYQIGTKEELYWFAGIVNGTLTDGTPQNEAACAMLTADIVVNTGDVTNCGGSKQDGWIDWTPIAYGAAGDYSGTFDGQGYTVSGLYCKLKYNYVGLFGDVSGGSVCNVGVVNSYIEGGNYVGGVCGRIYNNGSDTVLTISNCYNTGTVKGTTSCVGGVFGYVQNAGSDATITVTNCYNSGNVYLTGTSTSSKAGGVCGHLNNNGANAIVTLTKCYNTGNVNAAGSSSKEIGGVCGRCDKATISNCSNIGAVSANGSRSTNVGGVCGYLNATSGTAAKVIDSYSVGTPGTPNNSKSNLGGICGFVSATNTTVDNCYFLDGTAVKGIGSGSGTTASKTEEQFASGEAAYLLQSGQEVVDGETPQVWGQNIDNGETRDVLPVLGDAKVYYAKVYAGCAGNPGDSTGYTYSNKEAVYSPHADGDNDGKCDICGGFADGIGTKIYGYSLSLNGNIGVNFYMELSEEIANDNSTYMLFTLPDGNTKRVSVTDAIQKQINGKTYYVFSCEVAAKEMTAEIKARIISGNEKGTEYTYSVKDYADYILGHPENFEKSDKLIDLVTAMLNYGAYSQTYFGYNTDNLANSDLPEDQKQLPNTTAEALSSYKCSCTANTNYTGGTAYYGSSLVLKSETDIKHYFSYNPSVSLEAFTCNDSAGHSYEIEQSGNYLYVRVANIAANKLGEAVTLTLYENSEEVGTISYSPLSYAYSILSASSKDEALRNTVNALYQYYLAADAYFNPQQSAE